MRIIGPKYKVMARVELKAIEYAGEMHKTITRYYVMERTWFFFYLTVQAFLQKESAIALRDALQEIWDLEKQNKRVYDV